MSEKPRPGIMAATHFVLRRMMPPLWCRAGGVRACVCASARHLALRAMVLGVFGPVARQRNRIVCAALEDVYFPIDIGQFFGLTDGCTQ